MDISLLRHQYRRERRGRHAQVVVLRTVSEELSEAVCVVPVTQGLTSPWEPDGLLPPAETFDPKPTIYDPWRIHLGLHRRHCPGISMPETTTSRCSLSSSSEAVRFQQDVGSVSDSPGSSRAMSPFSCTTEEDHSDVDGSRRAPETLGPVQVPVSEPVDSASRPSSTPDVSISGSPSSPGASAPPLRFIRQPSTGGAGSPNHSYQPFPHRKTPRISDAARRLGMYSSCRNQKGLPCANINTE